MKKNTTLARRRHTPSAGLRQADITPFRHAYNARLRHDPFPALLRSFF